MRPPPNTPCTHLPVMPMFLTSTGLGTLDHTEKAVVRQYSTLLPRLSSTWKRGGGCWGGRSGGAGSGGPTAGEGVRTHGWGVEALTYLPSPTTCSASLRSILSPRAGHKGPWGLRQGTPPPSHLLPPKLTL